MSLVLLIVVVGFFVLMYVHPWPVLRFLNRFVPSSQPPQADKKPDPVLDPSVVSSKGSASSSQENIL